MARTTRTRALAIGAALIALAATTAPASAWTVEEHRLLADSALSVATAPLDSTTRALLRGALREPWSSARPGDEVPTFASVCAAAAADDHSTGRYHLEDRTVLEQLRVLTAARVNTLAGRARRGDPGILRGDRGRLRGRVRSLSVGNVVANYLVHHLAACRIAGDAIGGFRNTSAQAAGLSVAAGDPDSLLRCALVYEAIAQGYLADAFSAGHLMPPPGRRLGFLHPINRKRLHDHYGIAGLYVLDARGETWHTLGDRLLLWYGPSFDHVFDACVASLREVLVARFEGQGVSGPEWLTDLRLAALLRIPTVAVATWSVRLDSLDTHGMRVRHHYPQLLEWGGHDPTLDPGDVKRLPMNSAVPDWMYAPELFKTDPLVLVRENPDYASVRFVQPRHPPPSYKGLLLSVGQARFDEASGGGGHFRYGLGFSPVGEGSVLLHRMSIDALLLEPLASGGPRAMAFAVGFSLKLPGLGVWREPWLRWIEHTRLSAGHAWGRGEALRPDGPRYTVGLETPPLPLRFTDAAVTLRLEAEWLRFERPRRGLALVLVMQ